MGFEVKDNLKEITKESKPEDGWLIAGIILEGGRWNAETHCLDDANARQPHCHMHIIHFFPQKNAPLKAVIDLNLISE